MAHDTGLVVVGLLWKDHWPDISADFAALGPRSGDIVAGLLIVALYGAILGVVLCGVQRAYRAVRPEIVDFPQHRQ